MKEISNQTYGGERPLFAQKDLYLNNVKIEGGESSLKRCTDIVAENCVFDGKYPFWHSRNFKIINSKFLNGGRAALWYSCGCEMRGCIIEAPKMFRMMMDISVYDTVFTNGEEMLWDCSDIKLRNVKIDNCDYLLMHSAKIDIDNYEQHGNYSFQYCTDSVIRHAKIFSKDAFWNTDNLTIYDSELHGEYLGWYSKNLTLINCHISGTQPLCYIKNLTLINCTFDADCDLAFEESDVKADVTTKITSIKNPRKGFIKAPAIGEVIVDNNALADSDCKIVYGK